MTYLAKLGRLDAIEGRDAKAVFHGTHILCVTGDGNLVGVPKNSLGRARDLHGPRGRAEKMRERFTGRKAAKVFPVNKEPSGKIRSLGPVYRLEYTATKGTRREGFYHSFEYPRPVALQQGQRDNAWFWFRGGRYSITAAGIDG